jgi:hypothetical protein
MNKKEHLLSSLRLAINALKNDTIKYDWHEQCSCNAGVVSQAVLGISQDDLDVLRKPAFKKLIDHNKQVEKSDKEIQLTWKNSIKYTCPITGKGMPKVFQDLEDAGLSRFDIAHLEFMDNPAILAESTIEKIRIKTSERVIGERQFEVVKKRFFGLITKKEMITEDITEDVFEMKYPGDYYTKKSNLIKYLSAWIRILEKRHRTEDKTDKDNIEADLLNAVAEENYELAAELRNQIAKMF